MEEEKKSVEDPVIDWVKRSVSSVFRHVKEDKVTKRFEQSENAAVIKEFIQNPDVRCLTFLGSDLVASHVLPKKNGAKKKGIVFLKPKPMIVDKISAAKELICSEITKNPLEHLEKVIAEVYLPLIGNSRNQKGWGDVASKDIMDH
eukprot:g3423.t1